MRSTVSYFSGMTGILFFGKKESKLRNRDPEFLDEQKDASPKTSHLDDCREDQRDGKPLELVVFFPDYVRQSGQWRENRPKQKDQHLMVRKQAFGFRGHGREVSVFFTRQRGLQSLLDADHAGQRDFHGGYLSLGSNLH